MRGTPIKRMIMNLGNRMIHKTTAFKFLLNYFFLEEIFLIIFGLRLRPDGAGNSNATTTTKTTLRVLSVVGESHKIISLLPRNLLALCILLWLELIFDVYLQGRQSVPKSGRSERGGARNFGVYQTIAPKNLIYKGYFCSEQGLSAMNFWGGAEKW